jgi:DUF1680 family protein
VIEGASCALSVQRDPPLEAYVDGLIAKLGAAQVKDGSIYAARSIHPEQPGTTLVVSAAQPIRLTLRLRMAEWPAGRGSVAVNGKPLEASAGPGSYT